VSVPTFLHDFRHAIRQLRNSRGFSAVAIATIAVTVGANTAMFSLVNGMLLRPLPYPDPDRIVRVLERLPSGGLNGVSTLNYLDWTKQNTVCECMAAEAGWRATLTGGDEPVPGDLAACLMALALGDRDGRSRLLRMRPELVRFGRRDLMGTLGHLFAKGGIR